MPGVKYRIAGNYRMFRIRVRKTGRLADEEKFLLEKLEWVEIKA